MEVSDLSVTLHFDCARISSHVNPFLPSIKCMCDFIEICDAVNPLYQFLFVFLWFVIHMHMLITIPKIKGK